MVFGITMKLGFDRNGLSDYWSDCFTVMFFFNLFFYFLGLIWVSLIMLGMELTGFSFWVLMFN